MKLLCYPPANLIRGKLSFTGVVSVTLNFYWSNEHHSELSPPRKEVQSTRDNLRVCECGITDFEKLTQ